MWRTVEITKRAKLDLKLNYLVVRGDEIVKIHLSEISILIIENTSVSLTAALMVELCKRKIKVIFCDEKRNPIFENIGYYGSHDTSLKVKKQINWEEDIKSIVWTDIVREKITKQRDFLLELEKEESNLLTEYINEIEINDITNREGHSAKVYFNSLFGKGFSREEENITNAALNYGYSIILSAFNREITSNGYLTQLGLCHSNRFNMFNLASDLMEPFRILIDKSVYKNNFKKFESNEKIKIVQIINSEVVIDGKRQVLNNAIGIYCKSIFNAIENKDSSLIKFYKNEL